MHAAVEAEKKRFKGRELRGKVLGIVGLGAIGSRVAEVAMDLGMTVVGYDPALSVEAAWRLPNRVERMENLQALFSRSDYITLHLPLLDATRSLVNEDTLRNVKEGARLLNFAREGIVDDEAAVAALREGRLERYLTDFPSPLLQGEPGVVASPHLGASTAESEENCAIMAADELRDFLENGNITNAVNFPSLSLERTGGYRLAVTNRNVPRMLGHVLSVLADADINVVDMLNKSQDDIAYNLLDLEARPSQEVMEALGQIEGVINVRSVDV
jgi:D-3-phosphoglycerate dehydrogenase